MPDKALQLNVRMPLFASRHSDRSQVCIGSLEIIAGASDPTVYDRISELSEKLVDLCPQIDAIVHELEHSQLRQERLRRPLTSDQPGQEGTLETESAQRSDYEPAETSVS